MTCLPDAFIERMKHQLGNEFSAFLHAMDLVPVRGIRMNPAKPFRDMSHYMQGAQIPWVRDGYLLPTDSMAGSSIFHEAGAFYIQDPAAMLPVEVLNPLPGERILDLCAAPGGKSTQIGSRMNGKGLLICNEPVYKRAQILSRNIERIGIPNSIVINVYPENIPESWNGIFDGILVDAPCSGEGMFRKDPSAYLEWSIEKCSGCAKRQTDILNEASRFLSPGGRIVYSTCTYNPEENEGTVFRFLKDHPEYQLEAFCLNGAEAHNGMLLSMPHRMEGEGQFTALLRNKGDTNKKIPLSAQFKPAGKEEIHMLRDLHPLLPEANAKIGNVLSYIPDCPDLKGIRFLRAGLHIAEIRGKNLIPDHAAALSILGKAEDELQLTAEQASKYISGEELEGQNKGWTIVSYQGLSLGWGKGSGGVIKNHYPKGLRKKDIVTEA